MFDIIYRKRVYHFPRFTIGFAGMGLAMILGGVFTKYFGVKTALFGLIQIVSLCVTYYLSFYFCAFIYSIIPSAIAFAVFSFLFSS